MKEKFYKILEERNNESQDRKKADWRNEKEVSKEYNGRQILELLQNIDDQNSKEALIKLDTNNRIISIANKGEAFSEGGLKSLMLANLSPKGKRFIGNKGLGFRSLLNWSGPIHVKSSDILNIEFSKEARDELEKSKKRAILSSPKWIENTNKPIWIKNINVPEDFVTNISVNYDKEFEAEIKGQIEELSSDLMFFINNIETLIIDVDGEIETFSKKNWEKIEKSKELPMILQEDEDEIEHYQISVIIPPNGEINNKSLFSYCLKEYHPLCGWFKKASSYT